MSVMFFMHISLVSPMLTELTALRWTELNSSLLHNSACESCTILQKDKIKMAVFLIHMLCETHCHAVLFQRKEQKQDHIQSDAGAHSSAPEGKQPSEIAWAVYYLDTLRPKDWGHLTITAICGPS